MKNKCTRKQGRTREGLSESLLLLTLMRNRKHKEDVETSANKLRDELNTRLGVGGDNKLVFRVIEKLKANELIYQTQKGFYRVCDNWKTKETFQKIVKTYPILLADFDRDIEQLWSILPAQEREKEPAYIMLGKLYPRETIKEVRREMIKQKLSERNIPNEIADDCRHEAWIQFDYAYRLIAYLTKPSEENFIELGITSTPIKTQIERLEKTLNEVAKYSLTPRYEKHEANILLKQIQWIKLAQSASISNETKINMLASLMEKEG